MEDLPAHALTEVLIRVDDPNIRVLSLVCTSWRSEVKGSPHLRAAILVRQLRGRVLVKALSQDPPLVDIVHHLPQEYVWKRDRALALVYACHKGLTDVVELLLVKGAKVDGSNGRSPLYFACRRGHIAVARMLIGKGATTTPGNSWKRTSGLVSIASCMRGWISRYCQAPVGERC
jgi:hypothetical protein